MATTGSATSGTAGNAHGNAATDADATDAAGRPSATTDLAGSEPPADGPCRLGEPLSRRQLAAEIWLVLGVSLGASALFSLIRYVGVLTAEGSVRSQVARLNSSAAAGRPWLDLALQLASVTVDVVPALLAVYLLSRSGGGRQAVGIDTRQPGRDLGVGALLASVVGGIGLGFYLIAWQTGANLTVSPSNLPDVWWRIPVLVAAAAENGIVEEVVVVGYLLVRLRQLGWSDGRALALSAVLRGSYHLYQGLGGFVGNVAMGLLFGRIFQRTGRVLPLVIAHTLVDAVAFVGYVVVAGKVSWLPTG